MTTINLSELTRRLLCDTSWRAESGTVAGRRREEYIYLLGPSRQVNSPAAQRHETDMLNLLGPDAQAFLSQAARMTVENLHETKAAENYATSSYYECVVTDTVTGESVPLEITFGGMTTPHEHDALMFLPKSMMPKKWVKAFAKEYWGK